MNNNSIILIQRGISAGTHPVSGKSGKLYGQAVYSAEHQGVIFKMSIDQYRDTMNDVIGNTLPGQQWMPEIVSAEKAATLPESKTAQPARKVETPDVQEPIRDPDQDVAPVHAAAPVIGTDREHPETAPAPAPPKPAPPATKPQAFGPGTGPEEAIGRAPKVEPGPTEPTANIIRQPAPPKAELPPAIAMVVDAVSERVLGELVPRLDRIEHMRNGAKKTRQVKRNPELAAMQKEARLLGINSFGKSAETLKAEITAAKKGG